MERVGAAGSHAGAIAEELRGNAQSAREHVGVNSIEAAEALQGAGLLLLGIVGEGDLILVGGGGLLLSLAARELVERVGKAGGIVGAREIICGALGKCVEGAGERALRGSGDGGLLRLSVAGIGEHVLIGGDDAVAESVLLGQELLVGGVNGGAFLIGVLGGLS